MVSKAVLGPLSAIILVCATFFINLLATNSNTRSTINFKNRHPLEEEWFNLLQTKDTLRNHRYYLTRTERSEEVQIIWDSEGKKIVKYLIETPEEEIKYLNTFFKAAGRDEKYKKELRGVKKDSEKLIGEWIRRYRLTRTVHDKLRTFEELTLAELEIAAKAKLIEPDGFLNEVFCKNSKIIDLDTNKDLLKVLKNLNEPNLEEEIEIELGIPLEYVNFTLNKEGELLDKEHYLDLTKRRVFKVKFKLGQVFKSLEEIKPIFFDTYGRDLEEIIINTLPSDLEQARVHESSVNNFTINEPEYEYQYCEKEGKIIVKNLRINFTKEELDQQTEKIKEEIESLYKSLAIKAVRKELVNLARKDKKLDNKIKSYLKEKKEL